MMLLLLLLLLMMMMMMMTFRSTISCSRLGNKFNSVFGLLQSISVSLMVEHTCYT